MNSPGNVEKHSGLPREMIIILNNLNSIAQIAGGPIREVS
jgi:hypothetical protein